jgi:hypothetical protein
MDDNELKSIISNIKKGLRVTKVTVTRSVKTKRGDYFVGYSAAWNSVQDDQGGVPDADLSLETSEVAPNGLTLKEARVARAILAMEVDLAAHEDASAGGAASADELKHAKIAIKNNYGLMIRELLTGKGNGK